MALSDAILKSPTNSTPSARLKLAGQMAALDRRLHEQPPTYDGGVAPDSLGVMEEVNNAIGSIPLVGPVLYPVAQLATHFTGGVTSTAGSMTGGFMDLVERGTKAMLRNSPNILGLPEYGKETADNADTFFKENFGGDYETLGQMVQAGTSRAGSDIFGTPKGVFEKTVNTVGSLYGLSKLIGAIGLGSPNSMFFKALPFKSVPMRVASSMASNALGFGALEGVGQTGGLEERGKAALSGAKSGAVFGAVSGLGGEAIKLLHPLKIAKVLSIAGVEGLAFAVPTAMEPTATPEDVLVSLLAGNMVGGGKAFMTRKFLNSKINGAASFLGISKGSDPEAVTRAFEVKMEEIRKRNDLTSDDRLKMVNDAIQARGVMHMANKDMQPFFTDEYGRPSMDGKFNMEKFLQFARSEVRNQVKYMGQDAVDVVKRIRDLAKTVYGNTQLAVSKMPIGLGIKDVSGDRDKFLSDLEESMANLESKASAMKNAKRALDKNFITQENYEEIKRIAKDRDMRASDIVDELRGWVESGKPVKAPEEAIVIGKEKKTSKNETIVVAKEKKEVEPKTPPRQEIKEIMKDIMRGKGTEKLSASDADIIKTIASTSKTEAYDRVKSMARMTGTSEKEVMEKYGVTNTGDVYTQERTGHTGMINDMKKFYQEKIKTIRSEAKRKADLSVKQKKERDKEIVTQKVKGKPVVVKGSQFAVGQFMKRVEGKDITLAEEQMAESNGIKFLKGGKLAEERFAQKIERDKVAERNRKREDYVRKQTEGVMGKTSNGKYIVSPKELAKMYMRAKDPEVKAGLLKAIKERGVEIKTPAETVAVKKQVESSVKELGKEVTKSEVKKAVKYKKTIGLDPKVGKLVKGMDAVLKRRAAIIMKSVRRSIKDGVKPENIRKAIGRGRDIQKARDAELTHEMRMKENKKNLDAVIRAGERIGARTENLKQTIQEAKDEKVQLLALRKTTARLIKDMLPTKKAADFLAKVATVKTAYELSGIAQEAMYFLEKKQKLDMIGHVKKIAGSIDKAWKGFGISKYFSDASGEIAPFVKTIEGLNSRIDKLVKAKANASELIAIRDVLSSVAGKNIKEITSVEIEAIMDRMLQVQEAIAQGKKEKATEDLATKSDRMPAILNESVKVYEEKPLFEEDIVTETKLDTRQKLSNSLSKLWTGVRRKLMDLTPWEVLMDKIDGYKNFTGINYKTFITEPNIGVNRAMNAADKLKSSVIELVKKHKIDEMGFKRIGTYGAMKQEGGVEKLEKMGFSKERQDALEKTMKPEELEVYNEMAKVMREKYPDVQRVMREQFGIDIGYVENYAPFATDFEKIAEMNVIDSFSKEKIEDIIQGKYTDSMTNTKTPNKSFAEQRTGGEQVLNLNALKVFESYIDRVTWLEHMSSLIKTRFEMANSKEYGEKVGTWAQQQVVTHFDLLARRGGVESARVLKWLDRIRINITAGTLPFRLTTILAQSLALAEYKSLRGMDVVTRGMAEMGNKDWVKYLMDNSAELRKRIGDDTSFVDYKEMSGIIKKFTEMGSKPIADIDMKMAAIVVSAEMIAYTEAKLGRHVSIEEIMKGKVDEYAFAEANRMMRRTQGSTLPFYTPTAISRGTFTGNRSLDRAIFQFQNFTLTKASLFSHELPQMIKNKDPSAISNFVFWQMASSMLGAGMRAGYATAIGNLTGKKDETSYWTRVLQDAVSTVPLGGQVVSMGYGNNPIGALDAVTTIVQGIAAIPNAKSRTTKFKAFLRSLEGFSKVSGYPGVPQAIKIYNDSLKSK